ncbi:MAG TPA: aminoacyl-histidine dipeptidase [Lachnospiraceae bacterium]|nr:aminoacyl-histidine dipeptidase [Lachnospiraceae bacterium]
MAVLEHLEPQNVFRFFEDLCQIPHGSGDTKRISDYCVNFAKERGLEVIQDRVNNVIIRKPGTAGYEDSEPVILQGHLDMVCEKTLDSDHDFTVDPLSLYIEDGYVKARNTTLGGDDGIAVAFALAVLDSQDLVHPPIEAVLTVDEETSMVGAEALDMSVLKGRLLINIDSEEEGILTVGCAGGMSVHAEIPFAAEEVTESSLRIQIKGLLGGHSGSEIDRQRGNANQMMGQLLQHLRQDTRFDLISIDGGQKENVITYSCTARIGGTPEELDTVQKEILATEAVWKTEFGKDEPNLRIELTEEPAAAVRVMQADAAGRIIAFLACAPQGVQCFNRELKGQVETSLNLGVVQTTDTSVQAFFLIRSSVNTKKAAVAEKLQALVSLAGGSSQIVNAYPAWSYDPDSRLRPLMAEVYQEMFGVQPEIKTIHAGLECGLFSGKCPDLDCVSFGPNLWDIHSVNERMDIASVGRMWEYLKAVLERCR